jgi:hypothetical protein
MSRKTFYLTVGFIIFTLAVFFAIQISTMPAQWCVPQADFDCLSRMEARCYPEDHTGFILIGSWCNVSICLGKWEYYCGLGRDSSGAIYCADENGFGCEEL